MSRVSMSTAVALIVTAIGAAPGEAAVPHTVLPGETLWSIAAANNFTTRTVAAYNGLSEDSAVYAGETIEIPTEAEGAGALANAGLTTAVSSTSSTTSATTTTATASAPPSDVPYWVAPIYCPCGTVYLASNAAAAWNAMRQQALALYGIDIYPAGTLSGYRSYAQQLYLYNLYLSGQGALAAVPGTSAHEYGTAIDLADPGMATVIDQLGASHGWAKTEAPTEWWHVNYVGG